MAIAKQNRYAKKFMEVLVQKSVLMAFCTREYEGDPTAGVVNVPMSGEATVSDYDPAAGLDSSAVSSSYKLISIDNDRAINEIIDNYEAATVPANIVAHRLNMQAKAFAKDNDDIIAATWLANGAQFGDTTPLTKDTAYAAIVDVMTKLSEYNATEDLKLAVTPKFYALILKSPEFLGLEAAGNDAVTKGQVGSIAGFTVYVSNALAANVEFVATGETSTAFIEEFSVAPDVEDAGGNYIGATRIKGREVSGCSVLDSNLVQVKTFIATP